MKLNLAAREGRSPAWGLAAFSAVGIALAAAFWLRWRYVLGHGPNVDELTTLYAATQVLDNGAPFMPSGVLYTRGILSTYVTALAVAAGGLSYTVARLPNVLFGLATVLAIFLIGRKEWNARVGWLALVGLALLPEAIVWSGRIRFYSPLLFFVLLTVWAAYAAIRADESPGRGGSGVRLHLLFAASFVLALFSQEETVLLYPSLLLAMVLWRGFRYLLRPAVFGAHLICLVAMALRYAMEQIGQPGYFGAMQSDKPYFGLFFDFAGAWNAYSELLADPNRLPLTLFGVLAVAVALVQLHQRRWRLDRLVAYHQATLFFALQYLAMMALMFTLVGPQWHSERYLLMMQGCWLLAGAAGAVWLVDRASRRGAVRWAAAGGLSLLMVLAVRPDVTRALQPDPEGYAQVFAQVAAQLQPGDVVMSPQPPACAVVLQRPCDYYARQRNFEPYVIDRAGILVDRWSGAPLLDSADRLEAVIRGAPRVWLVADSDRLGDRFRDDFVRTVVDQFQVVAQVGEVKALLAEGWQEPPDYGTGGIQTPPVALGPLGLAGWQRSQAAPGELLHVRLDWRLLETTKALLNTSVQLVAADGARLSQRDGTPANGLITLDDTSRALLPDYKALLLPADLPAGRYRLEAIVYDAVTRDPVAAPFPFAWFTHGGGPPAPTRRLNQGWQNGITLVGQDDLPPTLEENTPLAVRLLWTASGPVAATPSVFIHLVGPDGAIVTQSDHALGGDFYPAAAWAAGDRVEDSHVLALPADLAAGEYRLIVGLYDPATGERLPMQDGATTLELQPWQVP